MSNNIVKYQELSQEELMALTGQSTGKRQSDFPRLSINKLGEDDAGRAVPTGSYMVSQGGLAVYSKTAILRIFVNAYQYAVYDEPTNTYPNRSVIFRNFFEEAPDELGGQKCGKVSKKKQEGLTADQLAAQENIKCYRYLYGVVSFKGVDGTGQEHDIVELPVRARLSGSNFMPIAEAIEALDRKKVPMITANIPLSTKREKQGTNTWYTMVPHVADISTVEMSAKDWDLLKDFIASIDNENKPILSKYQAATRSKSAIVDVASVEAELASDFYDDADKLVTIIP